MKPNILLFLALFCFTFGNLTAQEKNNGFQNSVNADSNRVEHLLDSQTFEFIANTALPTGESSKSLVGNGYSMTFSPEKIVSNLPFYGRGYSGMAMGRDKGMRFKGKPDNLSIEKKKEFEVRAIVKDGDTFKIFLSVGNSGYATLTISSNNRGTISYSGEVVESRQ